MKKATLIFLLLSSALFAQGKYAAEFKNLIGVKYTIEQDIKALKSYKYEQGNVIGSTNDGPYFSKIDVYRKGSSAVVLMSKRTNVSPDEYRIIEVLKINEAMKNCEVRTLNCSRKFGYPEETIVSVVVPGSKKYASIIKQAFSLQDIRFEKIPVKGIKCLNDEMN